VSGSLDSVGAITLFVEDVQRSKAFYANAFDVPVLFEDETSVAFKFENLIVNLLVRSSAGELVQPAEVAGAGAGSSLQLTIGVEDAEAALEELARRDVELLNGPIDRPWGLRTACFADPDGHVWELAQQLR
jgi:catechol 2,3-dioxygenase-like lactoylglutathione lyase family enzyme